MNIIGIGGVFLRSEKIEEVKDWYKEVLGITLEDWGGTIIQPQPENETVFSFFKKESDYFPEKYDVMINFQVANIENCLERLEQLGIPLVKDIEKSEYGTFVTIEDPEGRWIELWEK
ncbi:VOC family protein [Ornithinibacillus halotolerans]|uniref:Glyoxalase n=1 Tax=Ornithinibacillus halotolerans TaxID=1274357 RepID=A0A916RXN8_9BACI|nr:VOC family protein [Ornithinibacillus halotolerans]GGA71288.1 glyoxalase [Ornithinibacillus halotolerans]